MRVKKIVVYKMMVIETNIKSLFFFKNITTCPDIQI